MVCLGPRKKEKKANGLLSPDDAASGGNSRGISNNAGGGSKRGSKLKPPSKTPPTSSPPTTSPRRSVSPRPSVDSRLPQHKTSRTSLNSQRPVSPGPTHRRPASPQPSPRQSMASVRSTTPTPRTAAHSRNASVASVKKSPVAQMRQDFDTLKVKYDANEQLIAQQQAELELLKQQLAHASPPATPMLPPHSLTSDQPTPPISQSNTLSDLQQTQLLLEKEEALKQKEQALEELQLKLEHASKNAVGAVPSIVVDSSGNEEINKPNNDEEENKAKMALLAEKERILAEKETALEAQRQQVEQEQRSALEQVASQMDKLRLENEEAASQLAVKEKELDNLRTQIQQNVVPTNSTSTTTSPDEQSDALIKLQQQLDEQRRAHEESLRQHELAIIEKERLLKEQEQSLATLKEAHEDNVRQLKVHQSGNILKIKQQHKQDMAALKEQMEQVERTKQEQIDQQGDQAKQQQEYLDSELEKILLAFEQAEHNHTAQLQDLEHSHQNALSDLQQSHVDQLKTISASQGYVSTKYVPSQAVSWPAPQPLSMLRKTTGPSPRPSRVILAAKSSSYEPILTPLDTSKVQIYISSVSGNPLIKKNQDHIQQLLESQDVAFELIDVAASETALQYMKRSNNNGAVDGRAKEVPQLFVGGEFRGLYDDVAKHVEEGTLETILTPAAEKNWTDAERQALENASRGIPAPVSSTSSSRSNMPPPPVRVLPTGPVQLPTLRKISTQQKQQSSVLHDEDEALLKELENEMKQGNVDLSQLDQI